MCHTDMYFLSNILAKSSNRPLIFYCFFLNASNNLAGIFAATDKRKSG